MTLAAVPADLDRAIRSMDRATRWGLSDLRTALAFALYAVENDFGANTYRVGLEASADVAAIDGWTFTRATTGYVANIAGTLTSMASGAPRLSDKGLLIESQRTNSLLYSQAFENAAWADAGASSATVAANTRTAPDGTVTGDTITGTGIGSQRRQAFVLSANTTYAASVFIKFHSATQSRLLFADTTNGLAADTRINWSGGVPTLSGSIGNWRIEPFALGWYRISVSLTTGGTSPACSFAVFPHTSGAGTSQLAAWGAQVEAGSEANSYIPTTSATATRNADVPTYTVETPAFPITIIADYIHGGVDGRSVSLWNSQTGGTSNCVILGTWAGGASLSIRTNGVEQISVAPFGGIAIGDRVRVALLLEQNNVRISVNNSPVEVDTSVSLPSGLDRILPGRGPEGAYWLGSYLRKVTVLPFGVSDLTLRLLTSDEEHYGLQMDYGPDQGHGLFETYEFGRAYKQAGGPHDNRFEMYLGRDVDYTAELSVRSNGNGRGAAIYARNHDDTDGIQISFDNNDHPHLRFSNAGAFLVQDGSTVVSLRNDVQGAFLTLKAKLATDTSAQTGSVTPDKYLTLYDADGNAFKVPCESI